MDDRISLCSQILLRYGRFQLKRFPAWISQKITTFPNDDMKLDTYVLVISIQRSSLRVVCVVVVTVVILFLHALYILLLIFFLWASFCHQVLSAWAASFDCDMTQVTQISLASDWSDLSILASDWPRQMSLTTANTWDYSLLSTTIRRRTIIYTLIDLCIHEKDKEKRGKVQLFRSLQVNT